MELAFIGIVIIAIATGTLTNAAVGWLVLGIGFVILGGIKALAFLING